MDILFILLRLWIKILEYGGFPHHLMLTINFFYKLRKSYIIHMEG